MSKRQRSGAQSISLFPFLAVLVCAMGALILLLVVTTRRIRAEAVARSQAPPVIVEEESVAEDNKPVVEQVEPEPELSPPEPEPAPPVVWKPDPEVEQLKNTLARLEQERQSVADNLAAQREHIKTLQENATRRKTMLQDTQSELDGSKQQLAEQLKMLLTLQEEATQLDEKATLLRQTLRNIDRLNSNARSKFAYVPFDGVSGTTRRPIFIECTEQAIRFIPEGVTLSAEDLEGRMPGDNPLLAGATALAEYWKKYNRRQPNPEEQPEPYILLLVRPSGSVAFYVARRMLEEFGDDYGYELLQDDWELDLPAADPEATVACQRAVAEVLSEQSGLVQGVRGDGRYRRELLGSSPNRIRGMGEGEGGGSGDLSERLLAGEGSGGASRIPSGLHGTGSSPFAGGGTRLPSADLRGSGNGGGTGQFPQKAGDRYAAVSGGSFAPSGEQRGSGVQRAPEAQQGTGEQRGSTYANGGAASQFQNPAANNPASAPDAANGNVANGAYERGQYGQAGTSAAQTQNAGVQGQSETEKMQGAKGDEEFSSTEGGAPDGNSEIGADESYQKEGNTRGKGFGKETDVAAYDGEPSRLFDGDTGGDFRRATPRQQNDTPLEGSSGGQSNRFDPNMSNSSIPTPSFSRTFGNGDKGGSSQRDIGGRPWSFGQRRGSIGFERQISIRVYAEQIIVADKYVLSVGKGETREELLEEFTRAVDRHVYSWGNPPARFYWVPSLKFVVGPGGNHHYERIQPQLEQWGLSSKVEYTLDAPSASTTPE